MIAINDCLRVFSSFAAFGALAIGCSGALDASASESDELEVEAPGAVEPEAEPPPPPPRPPLCKTNADCTKGCPAGSKGCTCHPLPGGPSVCVPTCGADADCPTGPGIPPLRCKEGVCAPPPPPPACQSDGDCTSKCPAGATCACREAPLPTKICVATCSADSDCPAIPGAPPLVCAGGACQPPKPPPPPSR